MPEHQQIQQSKKLESFSQRRLTFTNQTTVPNPSAIIQLVRVDPKSITPTDVLQLQRTIGNRAVGKLLSSIRNPLTLEQAPIQQLRVSEEEESLQGKMNEFIQQQETREEKDPLQGNVQQKQGYAHPPIQINGGSNVNESTILESEAIQIGDRASNLKNWSKSIEPSQCKKISFGCIKSETVLEGKKTNAIPPVQRKIEDLQNVIFGLDGKSKENIEEAVKANYTSFDGADSYDETIKLLSRALHDAGKKREDYDIIYKVGLTPPENLKTHLIEIAALFDNSIDYVLVHEVMDTTRAKEYYPILKDLKKTQFIKNVGSANVDTEIFDQLEAKDSFEIDAYDLFVGQKAEELISKLKDTDKPVFVYNIIRALKIVLNKADTDPIKKSDIYAMLYNLKNKGLKVQPILSSSDAEIIRKNQKLFDLEDEEYVDAFKISEEIAKFLDKRPFISVEEMKPEVKAKIREILRELDPNTEMHKYKDKYKEALEKFKDKKELDVLYKISEKKHTLRDLLSSLFSSKSCDRKDAYNLLTLTL